MREELERLITSYRDRGLCLDSNLLIAYVVSSHDRRLFESFKRTRAFDWQDALLLHRLIAQFDLLTTTPHVLTEVNGMLNQVEGRFRYAVFGTLAATVSPMNETYAPVNSLSTHALFRILGLTDTALSVLAEGGPLVVSVDTDLINALHDRGLDGLNFNHLRSLT